MEQTNDFPHWYIIEGELPKRCRIILNPNDKEDRDYWIIATEDSTDYDLMVSPQSGKCSTSFYVCKKFGEDATRAEVKSLQYQVDQAERQINSRKTYLSDLLNLSVDDYNNLVVREVPVAKFKVDVSYGTASSVTTFKELNNE